MTNNIEDVLEESTTDSLSPSLHPTAEGEVTPGMNKYYHKMFHRSIRGWGNENVRWHYSEPYTSRHPQNILAIIKWDRCTHRWRRERCSQHKQSNEHPSRGMYTAGDDNTTCWAENPSIESTKPHLHTSDTLIREDRSTVDISESGDEVCVTWEGVLLCMGTVDLYNHEVPTRTLERTTEGSLDQPPTDTSSVKY